MGFLLRCIILVWIILGLLVIVSIIAGQFIKHDILIASEEVEGQVYLLYMKDLGYNIRVDLAGNGCFEAAPPIIPYPDGDYLSLPHLQYRRTFLKRISQIQDVQSDSSCR